MEKFVGSSQTHRAFAVPQVFNGVFHALLPLPLLGLRHSIGLRLGGILQCLGTFVGHQCLQSDQDAAHADSNKF